MGNACMTYHKAIRYQDTINMQYPTPPIGLIGTMSDGQLRISDTALFHWLINEKAPLTQDVASAYNKLEKIKMKRTRDRQQQRECRRIFFSPTNARSSAGHGLVNANTATIEKNSNRETQRPRRHWPAATKPCDQFRFANIADTAQQLLTIARPHRMTKWTPSF